MTTSPGIMGGHLQEVSLYIDIQGWKKCWKNTLVEGTGSQESRQTVLKLVKGSLTL